MEDAYEPYLIQKGFLYRTPKGRMVSQAGYEHLGLDWIPDENQNVDNQNVELSEQLSMDNVTK